MTKKFLTVEEYADLVKVSTCQVRRMCQRKQIEAVKVGSQWRIPIETNETPSSPNIDAMAKCVDEIIDAFKRLKEHLCSA